MRKLISWHFNDGHEKTWLLLMWEKHANRNKNKTAEKCNKKKEIVKSKKIEKKERENFIFSVFLYFKQVLNVIGFLVAQNTHTDTQTHTHTHTHPYTHAHTHIHRHTHTHTDTQTYIYIYIWERER